MIETNQAAQGTRSLRKVISQVLNQLGTSREARYYLNQFSANESMRFAVIKIGGAVLDEQLKPLAEALALLHDLGLKPILIHGAGPQLDRALSEAGIETTKRDGLRVTTPEVMEVVRPMVYRINRRLVHALQEQGVMAQGIQHGVFQCDFMDESRYGLVGEINHVDLEAIRDVVNSGAMPVVACLGENATGQVMNINADIAAREVVWRVRPHKIIFLTANGGLLDPVGRVISAISLHNDMDYLCSQEWVHSGMLLKLEQIAEMLSKLPDTASVSITSVTNLTTELFTHRGAGTLVRKGEKVVAEDKVDPSLVPALTELLEGSFKRKLGADYFSNIDLECLIRSASNEAVAIVLKGVDGLPYLDKFAVTPKAQGAGLGSSVWQTLIHRFPELYWRSRTGNTLTRWYYEQSHTHIASERWIAFSRGLTDMKKIERCRDDCFARPESWMPRDKAGGGVKT